MIKFNMTVKLDDEEHKVQTNTVELVAAERHFGIGVAAMFGDENDFHLEYVLFLAYKSLSFKGAFKGEFDEFIAKNPDVEFDTVGEEHPLEEADTQLSDQASSSPSNQESLTTTS